MARSSIGSAASRAFSGALARARYWFLDPVVGTVPRFVWGNDAGVRGNVRGSLDRARARAAYERVNGRPVPLREDARVLREVGFLPVAPSIPPEVIAPLRASYREQIESDRHSSFNGIGRFREASRAIDDPARTLVGLEPLLSSEIRGVVESYFGGWFDVLAVEAWRTVSAHGLSDAWNVEAYSNQWHNDRFPTSWLRLFVYLSDGVERDTGAFRCHSRASTKAIMRSGGYLRRSLMTRAVREALEDSARVTFFEGDAGAACFANAMQCLHRAGVPRPGYARDMLALTFRPATRPLPERWSVTVPRGAPYGA